MPLLELRKHEANDVKCSDLGWICIPLVEETYGAWGKEALKTFSMFASGHASMVRVLVTKYVRDLIARDADGETHH